MKKYADYLHQVGEYGVVKEVRHPIVRIAGLPHARPHEMVIFETGQFGHVYAVERDITEVLIFSKEPARIDTNVVRTETFLSVPVGDVMLGTVINPLGELIYSDHLFNLPTETREIEHEIEGINRRVKITKPFYTGVAIVDMLVPLGKGQRELLLGDKKTGKTAFILSVVKRQIDEGAVVIYSAIGKRKTEIKSLQEYFHNNGLLSQMIMVATSSDDSPSLIYLTPYTAMTLAEYFRDMGRDTVVILDDLSTHARFYREIALIAKNFPGRDSYPGDIFYTHARLLERAGNFRYKNGERAITCLPVVEIIEGNFTDYIATNIMSMTDGHIYFDSNIFRKGQRPAVNISLSVTRVGRQTQSSLNKEFSRELAAFLNAYEKMQELAHFGAELSPKVRAILNKGDKIYAFFNQHYQLVMPEAVQLIFLALIWLNLFDNVDTERLQQALKNFVGAYKDERVQLVINKLLAVESLKELLTQLLKRKEEFLALCKIKTT